MATGIAVGFLVWWDQPSAYQRLVAPLISSPESFLTYHLNRIKLLDLFMLEDKLMPGKELPSQYDNLSTYWLGFFTYRSYVSVSRFSYQKV